MATLTSHSPSLSPKTSSSLHSSSSRPFISGSLRRTRSPRLSASPTFSATTSRQTLTSAQHHTSAPSVADNSSFRAQNHVAQRRTTHASVSASDPPTSTKSRPQTSSNFHGMQLHSDTVSDVTATSKSQSEIENDTGPTADRGTQYTPPLYPPTYRYPSSSSNPANPPPYSQFSAQRRRGRSNSSEETDVSARRAIASTSLDDTNAPNQAQVRHPDKGPAGPDPRQKPGIKSTGDSSMQDSPITEPTRSHKPSTGTDGSADSVDSQSSSGSGSSSAPSAKSPQPPQAQRTTSLSQTSGSTAQTSTEGSVAKRARSDAPQAKELPKDYWECDVTDLGILISDMLLDLVRINDKIPLKDGQLTRFHSRAPPAISVRDYLNRLIVHATLIPPILLAMVYYIDRLCALYPAFTISSLTVHRFLIAAATVAAKGLSDSFWTNNTYARVGGVSVKELALLELEFLEKMEWRIVPPHEVLIDYYRSLVERNSAYRFAAT